MTIKRLLLFATLFLLGAGGAIAQQDSAGQGRKPADEASAQDSEWVSYRDAYRLMIRFEKYGKPKHLIQHHYQVSPKDGGTSMDGVQLTLNGPSTRFNLALDAAGRAVFPLLKAAYDDNAKLVLNRKANLFSLQPRVSIIPRADGIYEATDLRAACEQVLGYLRYVGTPAMQSRRCVGVRFSYPRKATESQIRFRSSEQVQTPIALEEGSAFPDDPHMVFKTATYRFSDWPEKGQIVTPGAPVAIAAVFD